MRRSGIRFAAAAVAALLLAGACGGDDDKGENASTKAGEDIPADSTLPTDSTLAPDAGASTVPAAGGATTTTKKGTTATTKPGGQAAPAPTNPPPPAPAGVKFAAPGKYTYDGAGTTAFGPPGQQTLTIDPPTGADQRGVLSGNQGSTEQVLRYQNDGAYLAFLKTSQPAEEFRPNPPVLAVPQPAPVGKTWSWTITSSDGDTTVKSDFRVTGNEAVNVGGEQVPTTVVEATITITSPQIAATDKRTMWISDNYRLIVKQRDVLDTTKPVVSRSDVTFTLRSTKPA